MQQHRIISLASILVMLLIPVIGWFLVAQPQLAAATTADQQRADMDAQIEASTAVVAQLKADSAKLPELNDDLNHLRTSIPAGIDSEGYIDGIAALAGSAGVVITALTVDQPIVYVPAVDPNAAAPVADADADSDATQTPVEPVVVDPAIVTSPLIDSTNFVAVPVSVEVSGEWGPILSFVSGLQSSPRLFLVTQLGTTVVKDTSGSMTASITGFIYAIPTGVEGKPRPISTTVKQLTAPVAVEEPVDEDADAADPDPTNTPAP